MHIQVEWKGAAKALTGTGQVNLTVDEGITFRQIIQLMAERYPALVGLVIGEDKQSLLSSTAISVNGERNIFPGLLDEQPQENDRLIFLSLITGG